MDFASLLKNPHFAGLHQSNFNQKPAPVSAPQKTQRTHSAAVDAGFAPPKKTKSNPEVTGDVYKVKSSTGKEFNRRRKQSSSEYRSMADADLLKSYDDAMNTGDNKKRKRILYYVKSRGLKVRQMRRKLNGSE